MPKNRRFDTFGNELFPGENQRKDGRYSFRYTDKETTKRYSIYATTLEELRQKEYSKFNDTKYLHLSGIITLNDMYSRWLPTKILRDSTYSNYKYTYEKHIYNSFLGNMDITKIKKSDIKRHYCYLYNDYYNKKRKKFGLSYSAIDNINQIMYQIFKFAIDDRMFDYNPCAGIMKDLNNAGMLTRPNKEVVILTLNEQIAFINFCCDKENKVDKRWLDIFKVLLYTGLRIGELTALTWDDIDFSANKIYVRRNATYRKRKKSGKCEMKIEKTKSNAGDRPVDMISIVRETLLKMKETAISENRKSKEKVSGINNFIFLNRYKMPYKSRMIDSAFTRILKNYEIKHSKDKDYLPIKKFTCHTLRHNAITDYLIATNYDYNAAKIFAGHTDISLLIKFYLNTSPEKMAENARLYEERIQQRS